ncbi:BCCT family transporter [Bacillus sp. FJAT-47783]|uniref:glycine betaine uptake BCCT transporter n=1 Tax=Bacillus sp. FJAT-47783 TaxID=2922712 RepID=UPI001FAC5AAB|nr:BCCT family transporter [Bacillus sp. FJAT-47783]
MRNRFTPVFIISVIISVLFIVWGSIPKSVLPNWNLDDVTMNIHGMIIQKFGWFYLLSATFFLLFAIGLIFSKYGSIKLGPQDSKPEYSYLTWFAMLFSAGMGIGLVFWGVAEPMYHYSSPPIGEGYTDDSAKLALTHSFFHWGLHPWGIYAVVALALAYFTFRKNENGVVSSILRPLFGNRINGKLGIFIDCIAVFATVFGVATSLGLGAIQISGGVSYLFPSIESTITTQMVIIIIVTFIFMISAQTGLNKGMKFLSNINVILAISLLFFLLFAGPTNFIMDLFTTTLGSYIQNLPTMSFRMTPFNTENTWVQDWTIFYWAWWIAWAPFVGTFIARVSKGRTIREFVIGVLAVPTLFGALWFAVFGGSAVFLEHFDNIPILQQMSDQGMEVALFAVLEKYPLARITSGLAILLISTFFITSADSATFVLGMQTSNGSLNPSRFIKFIWGIIQSAAALILLYSGGLQALQRASIIAALPFAIIMILMVISLAKALGQEKIVQYKVVQKEDKAS